MDAIDITDMAYSLSKVPDLSDFIPKVDFKLDDIDISNMTFELNNDNNNDYTIYIYLGIAILLAVIVLFAIKFYTNKWG